MSSLVVQQSINSPGSGPVGLAWNGRYLWNSDFTTSKLYRIDPQSGAHDRELLCPGNLSGLAWDGRSLWQSLHDGGTLRRINPETNDFDQTIMVWEHGWLSGVAWDGGRLWVVSQQRGQIFQLDPTSGDVLHQIPAPMAGGGLAYHDQALWLSAPLTMRFNEAEQYFEWASETEQFALLKLDPTSGEIIEQYPTDFLAMGLAWVDDVLWLSCTSRQRLYWGKITSIVD